MAQNEIKEDKSQPSTSNPVGISLPLRSFSSCEITPKIDIEISLSSPTHCFTRPLAPTIYLGLTLLPNPSPPSSPNAITLYTEDTPLCPERALSRAGFTITDLTTHEPIKLTNIRNVQRMANPKRRTRGSLEEHYFLTLYPGKRVELSAEFGRRGFRPQPWSTVKIGRELDEAGNPRNIRRSASVTGVDGLEPGHEYEIGLNTEDLKGIMWAPAAKEDILLERGYKEPGAGLMDYPWVRDQPLEYRVRTTKIKVLHEEEDT
ncbi:hypothetical protein Daesc_005876 [Daldinia eschscholtzii]|uniref:Uncharacterized protein n=1 Tax=Daldinia eschscholtzii TaxID=292717 RepID=A0AAX6MN08_9PEZI